MTPRSVAAVGPTARPPLAPLGRTASIVATMLVGLAGLAFGLLFGVGRDHLGQNAIMLVAGLIGVGLTLAAATRFWSVVVLLFVVRSSLDSFKLGGAAQATTAATAANGAAAPPTANTLDPGVVVALVFLMAATMWLIAQWRAGELRPASRPTKWFAALATVGVLSAAGSGNPVASFQTGLKICAGALMLAVLEQVYLARPGRGKQVLAAGAASLLYPAYVALRQLTGSTGVEQYLEVSRIRGTFVHSNSFATFLVIIAVMALAVRPHLHRWSRVVANLTFALAATLTLFTYARGSVDRAAARRAGDRRLPGPAPHRAGPRGRARGDDLRALGQRPAVGPQQAAGRGAG